MAYFRCVGGVGGGAVLTLTYSSEFYGETITATDGTKTVTKVAPSTGTMDITLPESGTWVVSATIDGQAYSTTVTVNLGYTASLEAIPDGSTVTPTDDIQTWLKCAGIRDKTTYTTLSDVLSDTDTLIALCADSNACDYMARSTNWASGVAADSTAMLIVGKYNYCANALLSNATWCETLAASSYWEYVFDICVPKMTGTTTPSGSATASSTNGSNYPWKAFDRNTSDWWQTTSSTSAWLQYVFPSPVCIKCVGVYTSQAASQTFDLWLSNDESTWTKYEDIFETITTEKLYTASINNNNSYRYARLVINCPTATYLTVRDCQFYGRTPVSQDYTLIHSAVEDSIFYMDEGTPVALCTIPSGDTIDVDMSSFKGQTLTLVSTVAKDPTNLSNDFSMNVRITPNITEIYLMPLKALYWCGHIDGIEDVTSANGWSWSGVSLAIPTHNKNNITITGAGVGSSKKITGTLNALIEGVTAVANVYGTYGSVPNKVFVNADMNTSEITSNSLQLYTKSGISDRYFIFTAVNGISIRIDAVWYE